VHRGPARRGRHSPARARAIFRFRAGTAYASRFEKISARWKGPRIEQAPEEAAAYADFQAEIEKQDYSFEKGSTVEGTVVQVRARALACAPPPPPPSRAATQR